MGNKETWISDALIVAGLSLTGYAVAFAYEAGYASYYGIPYELISLSLTQVLIAVAVIVGILLLIFQVVMCVPFSISLQKAPDPVWQAAQRLSPFGLFVLVSLFIFGARWREYAALLILLVIMAFFEFVFPLISDRDKGTYREKLSASAARETGSTMLVDLAAMGVWKALGMRGGSLLFFVLFALWVAFAAARGAAIYQETYYIDSSKPDVAMLRIYGDTVVTHEYDAATKKLKGDLLLTKISPQQQLRLQQRKIGPLEKQQP